MVRLLRAKPKPSQAKPNQAKIHLILFFTVLATHKTPFRQRAGKGVFVWSLKWEGKAEENGVLNYEYRTRNFE